MTLYWEDSSRAHIPEGLILCPLYMKDLSHTGRTCSAPLILGGLIAWPHPMGGDPFCTPNTGRSNPVPIYQVVSSSAPYTRRTHPMTIYWKV